MKIGIVGTGNMGRSMGVVLHRLGHEVRFGGRDRAKADAAAALAPGSTSGTNDEAAAFGELIIYTPRNVPVADVLADPASLAGKVVIDCANQPTPSPGRLDPIAVSAAEELAGQLPGARVVKAFNTLPQEVFELCPDDIRPYRVAVFIAGDDEDARRAVSGLADAMGFQPVDCGPLYQARLLEGAGLLIRLVIRAKGLGVNFALVKPPAVPNSTLGGRQPSSLK